MFLPRRDTNFLKNYVLVHGIYFHADLTSQSLRFEDLEQVKIIENCPNHKDCRDGLGQGLDIGESVPEMELGLQSPPFSPQSAERPRLTKTAFQDL